MAVLQQIGVWSDLQDIVDASQTISVRYDDPQGKVAALQAFGAAAVYLLLM